MGSLRGRLFHQFFRKNELRIRGISTRSIKTALYDFHVEQGGKMVDFAGFQLPVLYSGESISASHLHTRKEASLFDVSHMLQTKIHGKDRVELIERVTTADVGALPPCKATLSLFTHEETGGILDDLIITNTDEGYLFVVSNAGRRDHDIGLLRNVEEKMKSEKKDVSVDFLEMDNVSLIALQGPRAASALQPLTKLPIGKIPFMSSIQTNIGSINDCRVSRCGYTGEDGFEISVPSRDVRNLVYQLLDSKNSQVKLAGLGARDSLRLEAGLCLYGSDIDETTTPVEAGLTWLIAPSRLSRQNFPGANVITRQLREGVKRKRVGIKIISGPPARHGCEIINKQGEQIGTITSGVPSPSLGYSIAMVYLDTEFCKPGSQVFLNIRGKNSSAVVVKLPFLSTNYYKG